MGKRGTPRAVVRAKKTTREVVGRYATIADASRASGVYPTSIQKECAKRRLGAGELYWRYEEDFDPNESFERIEVRRPVLAVNPRTGHWLWFESVAAAGMHFYGYDNGAIVAMRKGHSKNGYMFVYADRRMRSEKCEVGA